MENLLLLMLFAIDSLDNILITDEGGRIQKFDNDGNFIQKWGTTGTGKWGI